LTQDFISDKKLIAWWSGGKRHENKQDMAGAKPEISVGREGWVSFGESDA
jgi:hypothetical protein